MTKPAHSQITGKVKKTGGWITCNGEACDDLSRYRSRTAFVPQEDVMHRELTVLDNITFSGQTRLPADWTQEMKRKRDGVLERMKWSTSVRAQARRSCRCSIL